MTEQPFDRECRLLQQTLELLDNDSRTLPEIYKQSGIPFYWLKKFAKGQIPNPSVNRVQYLYEFLRGDNLQC